MGSLSTSESVPLAISLPKSSTTARSTTWATMSRSCSTRSTAVPFRLADPADGPGQGVGLADIEAGRRLVGHEKARLACKGPTELHEPAVPEAECCDGSVRDVGEPDQLEHLLHPGELVLGGAGLVEKVPPETGVTLLRTLCDEEVLGDGQCREDLDPLEGPRDPEPGPAVRRACD